MRRQPPIRLSYAARTPPMITIFPPCKPYATAFISLSTCCNNPRIPAGREQDAGAAGSTSGSDVYSAARVGALLAALPRLQHLVAPRLALDETLAGQLAAARHLTELHACIHDGEPGH